MSLKPAQNGSLELQGRDIAFLRGLLESRVMTTAHVAAIFFDGKGEYAKKRLRQLKTAGLVGERSRRVNEPVILFLTRKAFLFLKAEGHLASLPELRAPVFETRAKVSDLTLRHELEIMDVKAAFSRALRGSSKHSMIEFGTWPTRYQFAVSPSGHSGESIIKPDGFIRIRENEDDGGYSYREFFLEVDRSSEAQDTLLNKAIGYQEFHHSGGFAVRCGKSPREAHLAPFRVLMVMKSAERRNNAAERLTNHQPRILELVWLTTREEVTTNPLGNIWIKPAGYREATMNTPFEGGSDFHAYRRRPERETFVESTIQKHSILED